MHAPLKIRNVRSEYAPWITRIIIKEMNHRDYWKRKVVASKSDNHHITYKRQRNRANNLIRTAKRKFCLDTIDSNRNNPKEMWRNINLVLGRHGGSSKTTLIPSHKVNNTTFTDDIEIAETLNTYFNEVGESLSNKLGASNRVFSEYFTPIQNEFKFSTISNNLLGKHIKEMKPSKAAGLDNIPARLLQDSSDVIVSFLANIFNVSITQGVFPDDIKQARISPIFKSGDKEDCGNYRPISVI